MSYEGSDFENYTGTTRVTKLRQYCTALREAINKPDVSADGKSASHSTLRAMLADATEELRRSERATKRFGGISYPRF